MDDLREELGKYEAVILYSPLKNEPDVASLVPLPKRQFVVPQDTHSDPFALAREYTETLADTRVVIFIPGTAFDASGTRHGRGAGWYDRFLSSVPREWLRIGMSTKKNFSETPLIRAPHDEPMDWIIIESMTTLETGARV
jgi:5-formyltetrahydrofolate cyclo-ligase